MNGTPDRDMTSDMKKVAEARQLQDEGRYDEAFAVVEPLLELDIPEALTLAGTLLFVGTW